MANLSFFRALRDCDIRIPSNCVRWSTRDEDIYSHYFLFETGVDALPNLLWAALSGESGVMPSVPCNVYLVSSAKGVMAHPYDDRGMDVIGTNKELMTSLYRKYNHDLLNYDRSLMKLRYGER